MSDNKIVFFNLQDKVEETCPPRMENELSSPETYTLIHKLSKLWGFDTFHCQTHNNRNAIPVKKATVPLFIVNEEVSFYVGSMESAHQTDVLSVESMQTVVPGLNILASPQSQTAPQFFITQLTQAHWHCCALLQESPLSYSILVFDSLNDVSNLMKSERMDQLICVSLAIIANQRSGWPQPEINIRTVLVSTQSQNNDWDCGYQATMFVWAVIKSIGDGHDGAARFVDALTQNSACYVSNTFGIDNQVYTVQPHRFRSNLTSAKYTDFLEMCSLMKSGRFSCILKEFLFNEKTLSLTGGTIVESFNMNPLREYHSESQDNLAHIVASNPIRALNRTENKAVTRTSSSYSDNSFNSDGTQYDESYSRAVDLELGLHRVRHRSSSLSQSTGSNSRQSEVPTLQKDNESGSKLDHHLSISIGRSFEIVVKSKEKLSPRSVHAILVVSEIVVLNFVLNKTIQLFVIPAICIVVHTFVCFKTPGYFKSWSCGASGAMDIFFLYVTLIATGINSIKGYYHVWGKLPKICTKFVSKSGESAPGWFKEDVAPRLVMCTQGELPAWLDHFLFSDRFLYAVLIVVVSLMWLNRTFGSEFIRFK
ncbi:hypothetical protein WICPIJ_000695 [Wickerhamomyces pijperi]|uniref:Uncharacterized protein n=1 Tax=Wickerhamomyces pijperi TaxID=599730 RepID=A0A9P8QFV2_WICPI|nr:hypothetical protein WICPIJ_000695 [Wickerhamomyces pijperi]